MPKPPKRKFDRTPPRRPKTSTPTPPRPKTRTSTPTATGTPLTTSPIMMMSSQSSQEESFHLFLDVSGAGSCGSEVLTPTGAVPLLSPNAADVGTLQSQHHQHSLTTAREPQSHLPHQQFVSQLEEVQDLEPPQVETQTDEAVAHAAFGNGTGSPLLVGISFFFKHAILATIPTLHRFPQIHNSN